MSAKTIKINKDELKTTPWGDVDKEDLRKEVMDAKNKNTLVNTITLILLRMIPFKFRTGLPEKKILKLPDFWQLPFPGDNEKRSSTMQSG